MRRSSAENNCFDSFLRSSRESYNTIISFEASLKQLKITPTLYQEIYCVGNKAKRGISNRRQQENKARQIFRKKTDISYPPIRTRKCVYHGVTNICFSENSACFVFLLPPYGDWRFCRITNESWELLLALVT